MCLIDVNDSIAPLCVTSLMRDIVYLQRNFGSAATNTDANVTRALSMDIEEITVRVNFW